MYLFLWRYKAVKDRYLFHDPARTGGKGITQGHFNMLVYEFSFSLEPLRYYTKVVIPHSSRVKFIATCSYSINEYKHMMKAQVHVAQVFRYSNDEELNSGDDQLRLRWMIYLVVLADVAESVRDTIGFDYHSSIWCASFEALYEMKYRSPVLWAEIGESSLTGPESVLDTTDKAVLCNTPIKSQHNRIPLWGATS
ncbi:hypothetical protein Tco_0924011 [Tanacetum coccineum]|uniref:Uncharacterized protein n=1 Tax=Tanacetum coccineum TaxID=301880 RepID=A0ABQ5D424_9ASTR